jgi:hypothetical protein
MQAQGKPGRIYTPLSLRYGTNVKSFMPEHSPAYNRNIRVQVHSYTAKTRESVTTRVDSVIGGINVKQVIKLSTASPVWGQNAGTSTKVDFRMNDTSLRKRRRGVIDITDEAQIKEMKTDRIAREMDCLLRNPLVARHERANAKGRYIIYLQAYSDWLSAPGPLGPFPILRYGELKKELTRRQERQDAKACAKELISPLDTAVVLARNSRDKLDAEISQELFDGGWRREPKTPREAAVRSAMIDRLVAEHEELHPSELVNALRALANYSDDDDEADLPTDLGSAIAEARQRWDAVYQSHRQSTHRRLFEAARCDLDRARPQ